MRQDKREVLAREARWAKPVAIASLLAVVIFFVSGFVGTGAKGEGDAALLRYAHAHSSAVVLSGAMEALGFLLLALPLVYLFRVVQARHERVQPLMIVLIVLAPLCLALSTGLGSAAKHDAASQFVAGEAKSTLSAKEAKKKCSDKLKEKGAKDFADEFEPAKGETAAASCEAREIEDNEGSNAISEASLASIATIFGIFGGLSLVVGLFYTSLWAMRTGILGRFWASLGMALGITVLLGIILFLLIWLAYLGLLVAGWLPGDRPPAWAAGEAIPWPSPGEKVAADLSPEEEDSPQLEDPGDSPESGQSQ